MQEGHLQGTGHCTARLPTTSANSQQYEGNDGVIDLSDDDPETVATMVQFLYTAQYSERTNPTNPTTPCLLHHVQVYCLADRCSIALLKGLVIKHLDLIYAHTVNIQDLVTATKHVYENTAPRDNTLNDILILLVIQRMIPVSIKRRDRPHGSVTRLYVLIVNPKWRRRSTAHVVTNFFTPTNTGTVKKLFSAIGLPESIVCFVIVVGSEVSCEINPGAGWNDA